MMDVNSDSYELRVSPNRTNLAEVTLVQQTLAEFILTESASTVTNSAKFTLTEFIFTTIIPY